MKHLTDLVKPSVTTFCIFLLCISYSSQAFGQQTSFGEKGLFSTSKELVGSSSNLEMQKILQILTTGPQIEWVLAKKQIVKDYAQSFKTQSENVQADINRLNSVLEGLTGKTEDGATVINSALSGIITLKQQKELELAELRLLLLTSKDVIEQLDEYIEEYQTRSLVTRADPLWLIFSDITLASIFAEIRQYLDHRKSPNILLYLTVVAIAIWVFVNFRVPRTFIQKYCRSKNVINILTRAQPRYPLIVKFLFPIVSALALLGNILYPAYILHPYVAKFSIFIFSFLTITALLRSIVPRFGHEENLELRAITRHSTSLAIYLFSFIAGLSISLSSFFEPLSTTFIYATPIGSAIFLLWLLAMASLCHTLCGETVPGLWRYAKYPVLGTIFVLLSFEIIGFRNLAYHITFSVGVTLIILTISLLLYDTVDVLVSVLRVYSDLFLDKMNVVKEGGHSKIRTHKVLSLGLKIYVIFGAVVLVLHQWGLTNVDNDRLREFLLYGFQFAGLTISPVRFTLALLIYVVCWPAVEYFKQLIDRKLHAMGELSTSARDTILTITGYLCYGAIILVMLGIAGVKMTGLTVIVGALSVGIGFGLQNIVNNFISGLILIFERPIKKGDWILVGSTEGYVKKISIRSTIVQTFDRADVIVPNSELISNQVTNMMFDDLRGRLRISVGVAYGSDTELVQNILLEKAHENKNVITDGSAPDPKAWFQAFGDSSLNFDLLCHLKDIDLKVLVKSELNMAIDKSFREHGIEIPYPQRDIHVRSMPS